MKLLEELLKNVQAKYMEITWKIIEKYIGIKLSQTSQIIEKQSSKKQETATTVQAQNWIKISVNKWIVIYYYY